MIDADLRLRRHGGWFFYPEEPSVTIHTSSGPLRVKPRYRWLLPRLKIRPDGSLQVKFSLLNRGGVDVNASIELRHDDGWWLSPERPQLAVRAGRGPVRVSSTFRPPAGHTVAARDLVTVHLAANGIPVGEATVPVRGAGDSRDPRVKGLFAAALVMAIMGAVGLGLKANDPQPRIETLNAEAAPSATTVPKETVPKEERAGNASPDRDTGVVPSVPNQPQPTTTGPETTTTVAQSRSVMLEPSSIDFGTVSPVTPADFYVRDLRLRNDGNVPVTITDFEWTGLELTGADYGLDASDASDAFRSDVSACRGTTLAPDEVCAISVEFHPSFVGTFTVTLEIAVRDHPLLSLPISAAVDAGCVLTVC